MLLAISLVSVFFTPVDIAQAAAPSAGTGVAWTSGSYFDAYSSQSGITVSDLSPTNDLVWQLYYANAPLTIAADGVNRLGFNTYASGSNSWNYRVAVSTVDDTLGSFGADTAFASGGTSYTAGGFNQNTATTAVNIPARRYFIIGIHTGAYYRTFKTSAGNRSAQIGGLTYLTAINTIYYAPHANSVFSGVPTALGGSSSAFTTYNGYVAMYSIAFTATGTPTGPALTTPDTPTATSISATGVTLSNPSVVANAQSYQLNLYASNGTTLLDTKTVTNSQVTSGYSLSGLTPNTNYKVGFIAIADGVNYSNSAVSTLRSFTTINGSTAVSIAFSPSPGTMRTNVSITATTTGYASGKMAYFANGKRIPGCLAVPVVASSSTCTWRPSVMGYSFISATFTPSSSSYNGSVSSKSIFIQRRSTLR
jgi:hypothetical protein